MMMAETTTTITNPNFDGDEGEDAPVAVRPAKVERPLRKQAEPKQGWWWGTGRRKTAVARVRVRPAQGGEGKITIRGAVPKIKTIEQYFAEERDRADCFAPLKSTNTLGKLDVAITCSGGGFMVQAGGVNLGFARGLVGDDPTPRGILAANEV